MKPGAPASNFLFGRISHAEPPRYGIVDSSNRIWEQAMHLPDVQWFFPILKGAIFGLLAMALHESGHLGAAFAVGLKVKRVGLDWKGMYTVREAGTPAKNAAVSLAGPVANLVLTAFWPWSPIFGLANLCCGACNLLPIPGSDGQRILRCAREMRETDVSAEELRSLSSAGSIPPAEIVSNRREKSVDPAA
jgi:Zn-dependent protease